MNPKIDKYIRTAPQWQEETAALRYILLDSKLDEDLKWGKPCYAFEGTNIIVIQGFKAYCALLFFKGVLLKDPHGILIKTGPNTHQGRQLRFTDVREIVKMKAILKAYIQEAIEVEKAGLKVSLPKYSELAVPEEFQKRLDESAALKAAFKALTPGRQRAYIFYFSGAKQSQTRESRVKKWLPAILKGKGFNE